jgi:hypothetical protein
MEARLIGNATLELVGLSKARCVVSLPQNPHVFLTNHHQIMYTSSNSRSPELSQLINRLLNSYLGTTVLIKVARHTCKADGCLLFDFLKFATCAIAPSRCPRIKISVSLVWHRLGRCGAPSVSLAN